LEAGVDGRVTVELSDGSERLRLDVEAALAPVAFAAIGRKQAPLARDMQPPAPRWESDAALHAGDGGAEGSHATRSEQPVEGDGGSTDRGEGLARGRSEPQRGEGDRPAQGPGGRGRDSRGRDSRGRDSRGRDSR